MIVKWLNAPGHAGSVGPNVISFAENLHPLIIFWSEMYWNIDDLYDRPSDYQHYVGPAVRKDARGRNVGHDVVISVHEDAEILHRETFFVSGEVPRIIKYMPERHGKAVVLDYDGVTILAIGWHPQPNPLRRLRLVFPKYKRGMERVQKVQTRLEEEFKPDLVLNGGDLQLGPGNQWVHPNMYASRNRMWYQRHRIDWQMWRSKFARFVSFVKIDPSKINKGMDHMWTMLSLHIKKDG